MKTDGFGITHRDDCKAPSWNVIRIGRGTGQRCKHCGIIWRRGDAALTARSTHGYGKAH